MPLSLLLLPLLAQVGPSGALPQAPLPDRHSRSAPAVTAQPNRLKDCLDLAMLRPADAIEVAEVWLAEAKSMADRAGAKQCKAFALTRIEGWGEAGVLFLAARDDTPAHESAERARLGAMGGNALIASGDMPGALIALDTARADASQARDEKLGGVIQIDRARALVALGRPDDAAAALKEAREAVPANASAWLLSATLSRRMGKLGEAQAQIERAAELMPIDPEVGLEAGVIAVLSGRDEAARKSWLSVLKAAPDSPAAKTAQLYLDQLGPPPAQSGK
jgi:tetratricopeptide (TPR) repeat protein